MIRNGNPLARLFFEHRGKAIDKWEQYLGIYARELAPMIAANRPLRLLEIGVQNGGSLEFWAKYLPEGSEIIGVDIDPKVSELIFEGNVKAFVADATDAAALQRVIGDQMFDVIIDDGSHRSPDVIAAFHALFDRLAYGGKYVVEDMHASYWRSHEGGFRDAASAIEFFKGLVDGLNADHFEGEIPAETAEALRRHNGLLASITFYDSVIVIEKLAAPKTAAYRRLLSGVKGDVLDPFKLVTLLSSQSVETLLLSEPQKHQVDAGFLNALADAQSELWRLKDQIAGAETAAAAVKERAEADAERDAQKIQTLESQLARSRIAAADLRNDLAIMRNSTLWRVTEPLRKLVSRMRG